MSGFVSGLDYPTQDEGERARRGLLIDWLAFPMVGATGARDGARRLLRRIIALSESIEEAVSFYVAVQHAAPCPCYAVPSRRRRATDPLDDLGEQGSCTCAAVDVRLFPVPEWVS